MSFAESLQKEKLNGAKPRFQCHFIIERSSRRDETKFYAIEMNKLIKNLRFLF